MREIILVVAVLLFVGLALIVIGLRDPQRSAQREARKRAMRSAACRWERFRWPD